MVKIKLAPVGKKRGIKYRVVVSEENSKITGKAVDTLGFWHPRTRQLQVDRAKLDSWLSQGAQPTASVRQLLAS